jgi:exopolysaccharide biosynthesis operon protein EpsL
VLNPSVAASATANTPRLVWRPLLRQLLPILVGACSCATALSEPGRLFTPSLDDSLSYDSNLLRTPVEQSDTYRTTSVGLAIEKDFSRQVFSAKVNAARIHFDRFSVLDYDSKDLQGNWNWHIGNHLEGNLGSQSSQTLTPFNEVQQQLRNLRTRRSDVFNLSWLLHPRWRLRGSVMQSGLSYDLLLQRFGDRKFDAAEFGVDYSVSGNNRIGLQVTRTAVTFPHADEDPFIARNGLPITFNDYVESEAKLRINWEYSGKTQLLFLGGWVVRKHDNFPVRDYNGANARLIVNWTPTGKSRLAWNAWREIGAVDNLVTSYSLNQGTSVAGIWIASAKTRVDAKLSYESRDYNNVDNFGFVRSDTNRNLSLSFVYTPFQHLQISTSVFRDVLDSNLIGRAYRANGVTLTIHGDF